MSPLLVDALGVIYVATGLVAAGMIAPWGVRGIRLWLLANRPHRTVGWILAPFWLLAVLGLALVAVYVLMTIWPIVAIVVVQRRRRASKIDRALDAEREEELFREVRRARYGSLEGGR